MTYEQAVEKLQGQEQVLRFYNTLSDQEKESLLAQIEDLDLELLSAFAKRNAPDEKGTLAPLGALALPEIERNRSEYEAIGIKAIQEGKIGAILLAGGQGTRLGFDKPKGMYQMGLTTSLYIFECLIHNLLEVVDKAEAYVPLFVMTSEKNDADTRSFFEEQKYFGYNPEYVHFFIQEMAPAVDEDGKILLEGKARIALSPNGNGGWFSSLVKAGFLPKLHADGIEWLNVFAVDNVLQRIADPVFVGATIATGSKSGGKVVAKAHPDEGIGVLCLENSKPSIVEYYEMTEDMRTLREPDGTLSYNYGVILNYLFRTDCLETMLGESMPIHVVHKKVPYVNADGELVKPETPNAYKFETLVLDMVHMQDTCLSFEVAREREFAPVKNLHGIDSVDSARELLVKNGVLL